MSRGTVLITGVSSGIGNALAQQALSLEYRVLGVSRRTPAQELMEHEAFSFFSSDLSNEDAPAEVMPELLAGISALDIVFFNAGILTEPQPVEEISKSTLDRAFQVNVWSHLNLFGWLKKNGIPIDLLIGISSGAALSGSAGWGTYCLTKSALMMLVRVIANENPTLHAISLAPGMVETPLLSEVYSMESSYEVIERLQSAQGTRNVRSAEWVADYIFSHLPQFYREESGSYVDIRHYPDY